MPVDSRRDRRKREIHLYLREDFVEALERVAEDYDITVSRVVEILLDFNNSRMGHCGMCCTGTSAAPPDWAFTVLWQTAIPGNYTVYVTGPGHTYSSELKFHVTQATPIPEFPSVMIVVLAALAASLFILRRRRQ